MAAAVLIGAGYWWQVGRGLSSMAVGSHVYRLRVVQYVGVSTFTGRAVLVSSGRRVSLLCKIGGGLIFP